MIEFVGQIKALVDKEVVKTHSESGDRMAVVDNHRVSERDAEKEVGEVVKMEHRHLAAAGRSERALDAEPDNQNDRERAEHAVSHAFEKTGMLRHELRQERKEVVHGTGRHGVCSYGMRQARMASLAPAA